MALTPPVEQNRPPDKQQVHYSNIDPQTKDDFTNSNLRHEETSHIAISVEELEWARRVMDIANSGLLVIKLMEERKSTSQNLSSAENLINFINPTMVLGGMLVFLLIELIIRQVLE